MPTSLTSDQKRWVGPSLAVAALVAVIVMSNRPPVGKDGLPLVNNANHYRQLVEESHKLTLKPFSTADSGQELTDEDRDDLREAVKLLDAQSSFKPELVGPYLGAGKAYALLGDDARAEERLRQVISNAPLYDNREVSIRSSLEAKYALSGVRLRQGKFEEAYKLADEAVKGVPNMPNYLLARASAAMELRRLEEAHADVHAALKVDPNNVRARNMELLLKASDVVPAPSSPKKTP
ncbi:MAG: hypothetical protein ACO1SV_26805 [Fimbriimonas sp.]